MKRILTVFALCTLFMVGCRGIKPPANASYSEVSILTTGYCKCGKCCGWKRNWLFQPVFTSGANKGKKKIVGQTASGTMAKPGTIAADTRIYPFGTIMYVEGYGYCKVEDRGGAIKGKHIDLYFKSHSQAKQWGRQNKKVRVWVKK